ncbi:glycerol ethanol, ferric requiring protein [Actinomortierella ambigua]|uniref:Glycerol ethanol, ferric requiring protein n=1 Tax=Actinomortierella ambigua TaxID=1343610 RepID=A0A9P6U2B8_9FUNG|nr:glycerol ethanol, ferric requiring protein [Actinomortierella ambigua]KAG0256566.1 glycerol ethanol, ferric requiring protein [Actinomortierella ambigua]
MSSNNSNANSDSDDTSVAEVPTEQKDSFRSFIATLAQFSGDLSSLTCPSFLLSSVSLLEYSQYWGDHPKLFAAISGGTTPEERLLRVLKWFISTLYGSYSSRTTTIGMEKKPYNPILGEQYFGRWTGDAETGDTFLAAEQVSHHPPIMGFHLENKKAGVILEGHCGQKSRFAMPAGIDVSQTGHATLSLPGFNEHYLLTLPSIQIRGIVTGRPFVELSGTTYIVSSTGLLATIDYSTRGYFSGEKNSFKASIKPLDGGSAFYTAQGQWSKSSKYTDVKKGETKLFFDAEADQPLPIEIKPVEELAPLESHKVWAVVSKALNAKDYATASKEKSALEEAQRELRRQRKEKGETQADVLEVFELVDEDADATGKIFQTLREKLVKVAGAKAIKEDETKPHWRLRQGKN